MTGFTLDPSNESHAKTLRRLGTEEIGWLGTIGRNGYPHAVPVWFLWHEGTVIHFSQPTAAKVKNLRENPRALFHLEGGPTGDDMDVLQGTAVVTDDPVEVWLDRIGDAYLLKYGGALERLGWTPERMFGDYSMPVVFRPEKILSW